MPSDPKRLSQVFDHIARIKAGNYPRIEETPGSKAGPRRIVEVPWQEVPEPSKVVALESSLDWTGITNRDQGHILLAQIDPGKITDAQRNYLIGMTEAKDTYEKKIEEMARSRMFVRADVGIER
jgi:hypothetical protein